MSERRQHFLAHYDWIRTGLMFEPRGHDMMSGSILYPPTRADCDIGILFIETSRLPADVRPRHDRHRHLRARARAGDAARRRACSGSTRRPGWSRRRYTAGRRACRGGAHHQRRAPTSHAEGVTVECPGIGELVVRRRLWRQFLRHRRAAEELPRPRATSTPGELIRLSPILRRLLNEAIDVRASGEPDDPRRQPHPLDRQADAIRRPHARNAVFYGDKAIDRSPCGTGTSARMAQLAAKGKLKVGDDFVHESIIGSLFNGRVEAAAKVGNHDAIVPSIEGWARMTGLNTIFIDDRDPSAHGFQVV